MIKPTLKWFFGGQAIAVFDRVYVEQERTPLLPLDPPSSIQQMLVSR